MQPQAHIKLQSKNLFDLAHGQFMPRAVDRLILSPDQHSELQRWVVALGTPQQVALRCRIILAVAAGKTEMAIAAENGVNRKTVRLWRERFRPRHFGRLPQAGGGNPLTMQLESRR